MSTIRIINVFSVLNEKQPESYIENQEQKWLSEGKPNFSHFEEDTLVKVCLEIEKTLLSHSQAKLDVITNDHTVNTDNFDAEPSTSAGLPDNEGDSIMSQALDLRLRINTSDEDIEQQGPNLDDANIEAQYKIVKVKEHVRKIKVGARRKSVHHSAKSGPSKRDSSS